MWAIILKSMNPRETWISGVFKEYKEAQEYLASSKDLYKKFNVAPPDEILEIPAQDYPVMFFRDLDSLDVTYVTPGDLAEKLLAFEKVEDEDHQYGMYYIFQEDYRALIPGEQYLVWINHHHIVNDEMTRLMWRALRVESVGGYKGIYSCSYCDKLSAGILSATGYSPPPGWQIIPWAESKNVESDSYLRKEGETLPKTHSATYLTVCSKKKCRRLINVAGECNALLCVMYPGEIETRMRCQLTKGHEGDHKEIFEDRHVQVIWTEDDTCFAVENDEMDLENKGNFKMFGPPKDVIGECNAHLYIGDDYGDNGATMRCQLPQGHKGAHKEIFEDRDVQVIWTVDERDYAKPARKAFDKYVEESKLTTSSKKISHCPSFISTEDLVSRFVTKYPEHREFKNDILDDNSSDGFANIDDVDEVERL